MKTSGRPGIPYEKFITVWEQLIKEGRARTNTAHDRLGGNKSTIAAFRERYEREKFSKELTLLSSIELPEAVHKAIGTIKVKEIELLEKNNAALKIRIDSYLATLKETEEKLAAKEVVLADMKDNFDLERLKLERKLAAAQARIEDMENREQKLVSRYEAINEKYNFAKEAAAVANKEVEMLRMQVGKTMIHENHC